MTCSHPSTFPPLAVFGEYVEASAIIDEYLEDLLLPAFNQLRAANGIELQPPPDRSPVTVEAALAAGEKYKAYWAALEAQTRLRAREEARPLQPRKPTLASVAKQASKAGIEIARFEMKPDGTVVVVTGQDEQQQGNDVDEWIAKHARAFERH